MKKILMLLLLAGNQLAFGQTDSLKGSVTFSVYAETYYCFDFNQPDNHELPSFLYNFKRHHEFNLNLGLINANYSSQRVRANFGLMAGTYPQYNLSAEQDLLRHVWQANIGLKLCKTKNLWLDAGILPSHIGFESAIGKDCGTLTRSITAENTPFYESGIKLGYTADNSKWYLAALVMNGWQRIGRVEGNNTPAFGAQITFTPGTKVTLNYSTFIGNDKPDSLKQVRYYHNFYGVLHPTEKFGITAGFDIGMEQKSKGSSDYNYLLSPVLILRYQLAEKAAIAARGEFYSDNNGIIIYTGTENGFQAQSYSANFDYTPFRNVLWRIEVRALNSKDDIFTKDGESRNTDTFATTSLSITF
ncbi:MAG TPA: porin [Chitinophagales bacterium]|nr:porin [Chitinophagales bacterium]